MDGGRVPEPLVLADQGFFWVGVERQQQPYGLLAGGQMFVGYQIPAKRSHALPVVMVHGGGGQGLDYLGTPDGRPGWATFFLRRGYAVYVVDRTALGRSPYHPDINGPLGRPPGYEFMRDRFVAPELSPESYPQARLHTQWPGGTDIGDPVLDQFMAGQGPSMADLARVHADMRRCAAALLDRIGPAVLITHSAGGPFGWLAADERPALVRGIVAVEPQGPAFAETPGGALSWGLTAVPLLFDPPASAPEELGRKLLRAPSPDLQDCWVQSEPARQLPNLRHVPVAVVTAEASWKAQQDHGTVDFLRQAGVPAEHIRLAEHGVHGNGHMMMIERNSDDVAALVADWIERSTAAV
ncbi:alpha/beta hydrolase [Roseomonas populi]|uniref:Alpha/beta hydrolase n=1 Tax=Roseomonas populi TaxID=3121582 RepID=A0ABT1WZY8_9PROT|nr:alpha/beta hydrolase [Roseomonas pecuniae]MCR0981106.1 alpha/beta hydrolase [Roseomonas pecuniae]